MFKTYSNYYDLLYQDKNYKDEIFYIHNLLKKNGVTKGDILEFGSGTGKHGSLLASLGFNVHGIEQSSEMVNFAKKSAGFTFQQGDIGIVNMHRTYDAIISLFHVMNYQTSNKQLQAVFANASKHLNMGGLFIFDFWYSPAVYDQKPSIRVKRVSNQQTEITRIAEPVTFSNENRVDVNYNIFVKDLKSDVIQSFSEVHSVRHFNLLEIDILSEMHDFKRINAEEFLTGLKLNEKTWNACVVLKK